MNIFTKRTFAIDIFNFYVRFYMCSKFYRHNDRGSAFRYSVNKISTCFVLRYTHIKNFLWRELKCFREQTVEEYREKEGEDEG